MPEKRVALPDPLPDDDRTRAMWIGYESSRWLPFDARFFLELCLQQNVPVVIWGDGLLYGLGDDPLSEWLNAWKNGSEGAKEAVRVLLDQDDELRNAHLALAGIPEAA